MKLAGWYREGAKVKQGFGKARYWYEKAANLNHAGAWFELGEMARLGQGAGIDYARALADYQAAAKSNHAQAQLRLGEFYEKGQGVTADLSAALDWYAKAAGAGVAEAEYKTGVMVFYGQGVKSGSIPGLSGEDAFTDEADSRQASGIRWLLQAKAQNYPGADQALRKIEDEHLPALRELYQRHDYTAVLKQAKPLRGLGGEAASVYDNSVAVLAALEEAPVLARDGKLQQLVDLAAKFDDPELKALSAQAQAKIDSTVAEVVTMNIS